MQRDSFQHCADHHKRICGAPFPAKGVEQSCLGAQLFPDHSVKECHENRDVVPAGVVCGYEVHHGELASPEWWNSVFCGGACADGAGAVGTFEMGKKRKKINWPQTHTDPSTSSGQAHADFLTPAPLREPQGRSSHRETQRRRRSRSQQGP